MPIRFQSRMKNSPDPRQFYRLSKLVLMPSLWQEPLGRVAVESLANGIPLIGSGRGGLTEVLRHGGIELAIPTTYTPQSRVPPTEEEVAPWIECITRLWDDASAYRMASEAARTGFEQWHPNVLVPHWERFLTGLTDRR